MDRFEFPMIFYASMAGYGLLGVYCCIKLAIIMLGGN